MTISVVLDACVLIPLHLSDLLLRLAAEDMYEALWSVDILGEVERNLVAKLNVPAGKAARRVDAMRTTFPAASVDGYQDLVDAMMTRDPDDRHVLAAAVRGGASLIMTANLKDFPADVLAQYDIEAVHPDEFLLDQLDLDLTTVQRCLAEQRADYRRPAYNLSDFYRSLQPAVPQFIAALVDLDKAAQAGQPQLPLPLVTVSEEESFYAFFPDGNPSTFTPLGSVYRWLKALRPLVDTSGDLEALSANPADWHGYTGVRTTLVGWSLTQYLIPSSDQPDDLQYAKLIPTDQNSRSAGEAVLLDVKFLTMIRCSDGQWRVWGLSDDDYMPSAERISGTSDY